MEEYFSIIPEELNEKTGLNGKQIEERILKTNRINWIRNLLEKRQKKLF